MVKQLSYGMIYGVMITPVRRWRSKTTYSPQQWRQGLRAYHWGWMEPSSSQYSVQLKEKILAVPIKKHLDKDELIWIPSPSGVFTNNSAYKALSKEGRRFRWYIVVWGRWVQPKHNFLAWPICSNSLQNQDRLVRKGIINHSECCLCQGRKKMPNICF